MALTRATSIVEIKADSITIAADLRNLFGVCLVMESDLIYLNCGYLLIGASND